MAVPSYKRSIAGHKRMKKYYAGLKNNVETYDVAFIRESYHTRCIDTLKTSKKKLSPELKQKIYNDVIRTFY